jgi:aspartokinase/homoserine dehydrogenase 1
MLERRPDRLGVVVSAMGGMTDALLNLTSLAEQDDSTYEAALNAIGERYAQTAKALLGGEALVQVLDSWGQDAEDIRDVLKAVALVRSAPQRSRDIVAGYGEIWSARLLAALIGQLAPERGGTWVDARRVITVRQTELGPTVLWDTSRENFSKVVPADFSGIAVMTGFIATDEAGLQTTLGRNGSDYSAAIFAALASASELSIWTDVDGVMSADPNRVPEARVIAQLTYNEAMELAYFGAKVIHPQTLGPVIDNEIPVFIRNSRNPEHPGSRIAANASAADSIKGITAIGDMALVNLEGAGMIGVPGTADRLFAALKNAGVSVTLISQASSEHSICIAVPRVLAERARQVISDAFAEELASGQIHSVDVTDSQSIVAVVGDGMAGTPGIAARFFGTLGRAGINVRAIAQGSSERNISAVVDSDEATRALRAAHSGFYLSRKTVSIGLIGPGTVGSALLRQIEKQHARLESRFNLDLRVRGIARSDRMLLGERRIDLSGWQSAFDRGAVDLDLVAFETHVNPDHLPHAIIIDCTASEFIASRYTDWLSRGIHVITPAQQKGVQRPVRKLQGAAGGSDRGQRALFLRNHGRRRAAHHHDALRSHTHRRRCAFGAGHILGHARLSLQRVRRLEAVRPFSDIVREARENGFTEPDPRDDLSGMDVARKLTILARELGEHIEIGDFPVQSLVPEALQDCSIDEFLARLPEFDHDIEALYHDAVKQGRQLRYIARFEAGGEASVGLEAVEPDHSFCNINLTDNIVQFKSDRYSANPLVVQGPGAGPEVTAAGVFADLLRLANYLSTGEGYV